MEYILKQLSIVSLCSLQSNRDVRRARSRCLMQISVLLSGSGQRGSQLLSHFMKSQLLKRFSQWWIRGCHSNATCLLAEQLVALSPKHTSSPNVLGIVQPVKRCWTHTGGDPHTAQCYITLITCTASSWLLSNSSYCINMTDGLLPINGQGPSWCRNKLEQIAMTSLSE